MAKGDSEHIKVLTRRAGLESVLTPRAPPRIPTFAPLVNVILYLKPDFAKNGRPERLGYRYALTITSLLPADRVRKETPLERGRRFQAMLDSGQVKNRADLARMLGCSRAWVTKVLSQQRGLRRGANNPWRSDANSEPIYTGRP